MIKRLPFGRPLVTPDGAVPLVVYLGAVLAGVAVGVSVGAGVLTLLGQSVFDLAPRDAQVLLVLGPVAGLMPVAGLGVMAARVQQVERCAMLALFLWLLTATAVAGLTGVRHLLT